MLVLASGSPRRRELISLLGVPFKILPSKADEELCALLSPQETVKELSRRKAEAVYRLCPDDLVLGVDTVVSIDGKILGKPRNASNARQMLGMLSGRTHEVFSGFTLIGGGKTYSESVCTSVRFAQLSEYEIERYVHSGEPMDKAGAYGIQGGASVFVEGIHGDYFNVVGLPLERIYRAMKNEFGVVFK